MPWSKRPEMTYILGKVREEDILDRDRVASGGHGQSQGQSVGGERSCGLSVMGCVVIGELSVA